MMASFAFQFHGVQARGTRQGFAPPRKLRPPLTEPARLREPIPDRKAKVRSPRDADQYYGCSSER
jgi:hypothetical protein